MYETHAVYQCKSKMTKCNITRAEVHSVIFVYVKSCWCVYLCRHQDAEEGLIAYEECGEKSTIPYHIKDLDGGIYPQLGDKVR